MAQNQMKLTGLIKLCKAYQRGKAIEHCGLNFPRTVFSMVNKFTEITVCNAIERKSHRQNESRKR